MMIKDPYLVLGIDAGIGSAGWSLLDIANNEVVDLGVHLWEVPQEPKTKASTAATRREARSARRTNARRAKRMAKLREALKSHGLVPEDAEPQWFQTVKGDLQPIECRVEGLDRLLTDRELSLALYSICRRRGYIPHGEGSSSSDEGKVLAALSSNRLTMRAKGYRTVGEMMFEEGKTQGASCGLTRNKGDDYSHCIAMENLMEEAAALIRRQGELGNPKATEKLLGDFIEVATWEKPTYGRDMRIYGTVGRCVYFPEEKRAARACPSFELCSAHERLCNVRIVYPDRSEASLPAETREKAIGILFSAMPLPGNKGCKLTYKRLRKMMDLPAEAFFKGVEKEDREVFTPKAWRKMRESLPSDLTEAMKGNVELADRIASALTFSSTEQSLRERLAGTCAVGSLSDDDIDAICSLPYSGPLFSGYGNRSLKALHMLCDAFEDYRGVRGLAEAEAAGGLDKKRRDVGAAKGFSLPPYSDYDPDCTNPVVLRVMGRIRKLVNAIIGEYGVPDEVHIELARDLKHSNREKAQISSMNKARKSANESSRKIAAEFLGCPEVEVPGKVVRKLNLLDEQEGFDIYTGEKIQVERLIADSAYCQIDHILPYSRTCDDSWSNKVLCLSKSNQEKGERSPYEWLEPQGRFGQLAARMASLRGRYPYKKIQKLLEENLDEKQGSFIERNINDTRYASRNAVAYIADCLEFPEKESPNGTVRRRHVCAVAGGATSKLRHVWGFDRKDREADDLHHAIDASIIAACREETVKKVALYSATRHTVPPEERDKLLASSEPWEGFASDVQARAEKAIPTRKPEHGATGRLFEDTVYSYGGIDPEKPRYARLTAKGKSRVSGNYVVREDGSAVLPDGIAFLRLWWDPDMGSHGKYLKEPVYYSDIDAIRKGTYEPRYFTTKSPRPIWPCVPSAAVDAGPACVLHHGDLVVVGKEAFRYDAFDANTGSLKFSSLRKFTSRQNPSEGLSKACSADFIRVIPEDILGKCFKQLPL